MTPTSRLQILTQRVRRSFAQLINDAGGSPEPLTCGAWGQRVELP